MDSAPVYTIHHHGEGGAGTPNQPRGTVLGALKTAFIGGTCGILGRLIDFPFDTIKTRLQTAHLSTLQAHITGGVGSSAAVAAAVVESPLQCLRNTLRAEGFRGLYRGCITPCLGAAIEDSVSFSVFHGMARMLGPAVAGSTIGARHARPEDLSLSNVFLAGSCGGMSTSFMLTPLELVKCRLQVDRVGRDGAGAAKPRFTGPLDCLVKSVREEGFGVLFRGHSATFLREALGTGCWFLTYESAMRYLAPGVPRDDVSPATIVMSGALSGMVLNAVPYPFDTAKSVLQTMSAAPAAGGAGAGSAVSATAMPRGVMGAMRLIVAAQGVQGLYLGLVPAVLRAAPANAAVFVTYETLNRMLRHIE